MLRFFDIFLKKLHLRQIWKKHLKCGGSQRQNSCWGRKKKKMMWRRRVAERKKIFCILSSVWIQWAREEEGLLILSVVGNYFKNLKNCWTSYHSTSNSSKFMKLEKVKKEDDSTNFLDKVFVFTHSFREKVFLLHIHSCEIKFCLFTPILRLSFCLFTCLFETKFFLFTPPNNLYMVKSKTVTPNSNQKSNQACCRSRK